MEFVSEAPAIQNFFLHHTLERGMSVSVRSSQWCFIRTFGDVDELYDRKKDPHQLKNLASREELKEVCIRHERMLTDWMMSQGFRAFP